MRILYEIYERMLCCPQVPPETGGLLGIKGGIVCEYVFDSGVPDWNWAVYVPDVFRLNSQLRLWAKCGIAFAGLVHSHPVNQMELSADDKDYIYDILCAMPPRVDSLYFPIVFPGIGLRSFKAIRCGDRIDILQDKIRIVKGV